MSYLVATPQGYRRKIGPRSRYGTTPDEQVYRRSPTMADRVNRDTQLTGSNSSGIDAHFGSDSMRRRKELDDRETADRYLADQEKRRSNQARKREEAQRNADKTAQGTATARSVMGAVSKGDNMLSKVTGGISAFMDSQRSQGQMREARVKQAAADRAKGRAKYEAERIRKIA